MNNDELILKFGQHVGVEDLTFNKQRSLQLRMNDEHASIMTEVSNNSILFTSIIGGLSPNIADSFALLLLGLNVYFVSRTGPYVSWDPHSNQLLLSILNSTDNLEPHHIEAILENLTMNVNFIRGILNDNQITFNFPLIMEA